MLIDKKKIYETLFLIVLGVVFLGFILLVYRTFTPSEQEKLLTKELKEIKVNQEKLLKNEKLNYQVIDSLKNIISKKEIIRDKIIEKHYHTKEIINQKIQQDEKDIINSNVSLDSIKSYLSKYRYEPIRKTIN